MTMLEQQVLEIARHFIPEIAKQLLRIADDLEAFVKLAAEQAKEK